MRKVERIRRHVQRAAALDARSDKRPAYMRAAWLEEEANLGRRAYANANRRNLSVLDPLLDPANVPSADRLSWWKEQYTDDGGGFQLSWADKYGLADLAATTAARRPAIIDPDSRFAGLPSYDFDGSDDFVTGGLVSTYNDVHNGGGAIIAGRFIGESTSATQAVQATCSENSTNVGHNVNYDGTAAAETLTIRVRNGTATLVVDASGSASPVGSITSYAFAYKTGGIFGSGDDWQLYINGVLVDSGAEGATPSGANATSVIRVGNLPNGTRFLSGPLNECLIIKDPTLIAEVAEYMASI